MNNIHPIDDSEIFDQQFLEDIISFAEPVLDHQNPNVVRMVYTKLAQMIGCRSQKIFEIFQEQIHHMLAKKPSPKEFRFKMVPFSRFIANKQSVSCALNVLDSLYEEIYKPYKKDFCDIISQFLMQSFRITPDDFRHITNIPAANKILSRLFKKKATMVP